LGVVGLASNASLECTTALQIPRRMAVSDKAERRITKDRIIWTVCVEYKQSSTERLLKLSVLTSSPV
jgi:hypothetical protein